MPSSPQPSVNPLARVLDISVSDAEVEDDLEGESDIFFGDTPTASIDAVDSSPPQLALEHLGPAKWSREALRDASTGVTERTFNTYMKYASDRLSDYMANAILILP